MKYKPHKRQLEVHHASKDKKRFVLNWGRQTGKTVLAINYAWIEAVKKQGRYFIVYETYAQAESSAWQQYLGFIPEGLIAGVDNNKLKVTLHNDMNVNIVLPWGEKMHVRHTPDKPPSTIEFKGSDLDSAERLRGAKVNGFVFDEYARHKPAAWREIFEPMMSTTDGWAMFISSPRGFNHFYDMWNYAQKHPDEWFTSHATPYDNPDVNLEFLERKKKESEETDSIDTFYQEYMAEFRKMEGLVYRHWDREVHLVNPEDVPQHGTRIIGIDFGYENPTAVCFILIDYDNNWWVYDEVYERKKTINDIIPILKDKTMGQTITLYAADSAASEHIANMQRAGFPIVPVSKKKDAIHTGIELIADKMKPREQFSGPPKPKLFVSRACENFIYEIEQYHYPMKRLDRNAKEEPVKENDHLMDAIRYAALTYQQSRQKEVKFPQFTGFSGGFYR